MPAITSIRVPYESLAARATALVCSMIRAGSDGLSGIPEESLGVQGLVPRESTNGPDGQRIGRWLGQLDQEGSAELAIGRMAADLGVSRRTLERQFQRLVGHSPAEEIRRRRLDRAKELLNDQSVPIADVAGRVGFTAAAFSRFFRQQTGSTPREYRQASAERLLGRAAESPESDQP